MTGHHTFEGDAWEFPARLVDVVDGDTYDLEFDLGFNVTKTARVRLFGVDTAEIYGVSHDSEEYERGMDHKAFAEQWFLFEETAADEWPLDVVTLKETGKYGRYIATIHGPGGESLTQALTEEFDEL